MIDTAGKEEHLTDQLIHSVNLCGAHHVCQVLWNTQEAGSAEDPLVQTDPGEVVASMRSWLA